MLHAWLAFLVILAWVAGDVNASSVQTYAAPLPPASPPKKGAYTYVIPGPDVNQHLRSDNTVYWKVGDVGCPSDAIRCTAVLIAPGGYGFSVNGYGCGGGGGYVTGIELAPSLSYTYELLSPARYEDWPYVILGHSTLFDATHSYYVRVESGKGAHRGDVPQGGGYSSNYPPGMAPGTAIAGYDGYTFLDNGAPCIGGYSWGRGLTQVDGYGLIFDPQSTNTKLTTEYPWGGGGSLNVGGQGALLITEFYAE
jgi:hypothetical protein